jgi:hypothetical protein
MTAGKYFLFIKSGDGVDRSGFQSDYLAAAREYLRRGQNISRLVLNCVGDPPPDRPYQPSSDVNISPDRTYDVIIELTASGLDAPVEPHLEAFQSLIPGVKHCHIYRAEEFIERDEGNIVSGERSPGIKYIGRLMFHPDLPDSAARRSWDIHANLAKTVHAGATKYVRNWLVQTIGDGAPRAQGISELHFPTLDAMLRRFFDSERGKMEILHDTSHFISEGARFYVTEYVLAPNRGPNQAK